MREHHSYLPDKEAELIDWLDNFIQKVETNFVAWQIPEAEVVEIAGKTAAFKNLHTKCAGPDRTKTLVVEKDAAKAELIARVRAMVDFRFANPVIPDASRIECGLHAKDRVRTVIGAPSSRALITDIKALGGFRLEIRFQDEATPDTRAIPYGCNGCLLYYSWGAEKLLDYTVLKDTKLMTHNPFVLDLPPEAEGRFASCAVRWQNERGDLGPWSDIMHSAVK